MEEFSRLLTYLRDCRDRIACPEKPAVLVVGHTAPDTDAAVSSVAEAYRLAAAGIPAVPVIRAPAVPREIAWLMGDAAPLLLCQGEAAVEARFADPETRFVLTDHFEEEALTDRIIAVIDHHTPLAPVPLPPEVCMRPVGAATTLVAGRWRQDGLTPDAAVARILLGAILSDTACLAPEKTRPEDREAADRLLPVAGIDPRALYAGLQAELLSEEDPAVLYARDYRLFDQLGFAILKIRRDASLDGDRLRQLLREDRRARGKPVCLAKITRYDDSGISGEEYVWDGTPQAAAAVRRVLTGIGGEPVGEDCVRIPSGGGHLSRKRLAPLLFEALRGI